MKKKVLLLSIIIFPSLLYFVFELTQANFKKMPYFGPKSVNEKGDTVYWTVPDKYFVNSTSTWEIVDTSDFGETITTTVWKSDSLIIDTLNYPIYSILFLDKKLKSDGYKLAGLYDYMKYKPKDLKDIPVLIVSDITSIFPDWTKFQNKKNKKVLLRGDFDSLKINLPNFSPLFTRLTDREKFLSETYFKQKPIHVFDYFMVLVDKKRHIRGYYDPSFNAEVKRMIDEYKHLKIRDEYAETLKQNDIKQNESK